MPLVSIVVPTRNRPEMLDEALASIREQTFTDFEIIVVSNGEASKMRRRSQAIATVHDCRYFALREGNVSSARNFAIACATGQWIAFLDDDDLWLPHTLARQMSEAQRQGADVIAADYMEIYPGGRTVVRRPRAPDGWSYTKALNSQFWWAPPSTVIVRKSVIEAAGGFDRRLRWGEDGDLWRRISWNHTIRQTDEILVRYRQGHATAMHPRNFRKRNFYDLIYYAKIHRDTPSDLRDTLPSPDFFWNRIAIMCLPERLTRHLELTHWGGAQWHRLNPLQIWQILRSGPHMKQPLGYLGIRARISQLRGHLKVPTRVKVAVRAFASAVGLKFSR